MTNTLKESIASARQAVPALGLPNFSLPLRTFTQAAEQATAPFESLEPMQLEDDKSDHLIEKARNSGIPSFTLRELRWLAGALWRKVDGGCIAENSELLSEYLRKIISLRKRSHFRALAWSYLYHFSLDELDKLGFIEVVNALVEMLDFAPTKWQERHEHWGIFSGADAVQSIAEHFLSADNNEQAIAEAAKKIGLDNQLTHSGIAPAAFRTAMRKYANVPQEEQENYLDSLIAWHGFATQTAGFCNPDYAEGLLCPWIGKKPPEGIHSKTRQVLLATLGDPRIQQEKWLGVDDNARTVMFRWLIEVSLEQFFSVITHVAQYGEGEHMWERRKHFWYAFYRRGALSEAWVAFGRKGTAYLRRSSDEVHYAEVGGAQPNHAVLLMRIGNLTIADWNVNGRCHIWHSGNPNIPKFYENSYSAYELGKGNDESDQSFVHVANGNWRSEVANYIRDRTGIDIPYTQYAPLQPIL